MSDDNSDNIGYNGNIMINKKEIFMKLRLLTKEDLGKCVENNEVVAEPLYLMNDAMDYDDLDDYDDLLWNIPLSEC